MNETLLYVGIACVICAVVGGGFTGLGMKFPVLSSGSRQLVLAAIGVLVIAAAFIVKNPPATTTTTTPTLVPTTKGPPPPTTTAMSPTLAAAWLDELSPVDGSPSYTGLFSEIGRASGRDRV